MHGRFAKLVYESQRVCYVYPLIAFMIDLINFPAAVYGFLQNVIPTLLSHLLARPDQPKRRTVFNEARFLSLGSPPFLGLNATETSIRQRVVIP